MEAAGEPAPAAEVRSVEGCLAATGEAAGNMSDAVDCCRVLDAHFSEQMLQPGFDLTQAWPTRDECCATLGWVGGLACTPWGPPAPPGASGAPRSVVLDLRDAARAERIAIRLPPPGLRAATRSTWHARMLNEHGSAAVFEALAVQLSSAGAPAEAVAEVASFAAEERRHGVLCGAVVESLGGEAVGTHVQEAFPAHPEVSRLEAALRNLISIGCLSETVAVALIGAEHHDMPEGPLKTLLTEIWADEVGHARAGWRWLAELLGDDVELRDRLGAWLRIAFNHLEAHETALLPEDARFGPAGAPWGLCDGEPARQLFYDTVRHIIVPGLEQLGIPASAAWDRRISV